MTLIHFMRLDEIEHYSQAKNSYFMAHINEQTLMKSLLYVKPHAWNNTFKVQNVYLRDITSSNCTHKALSVHPI